MVSWLQSSLIDCRDEVLQAHDADLVRAGEVFPEPVADIELTKAPTRTPKHEVGSLIKAGEHCVGEANDLKRNLLFSGAGDLLPFHRNQPLVAVPFRDGIHDVASAPETRTDANLRLPLIAAALERR